MKWEKINQKTSGNYSAGEILLQNNIGYEDFYKYDQNLLATPVSTVLQTEHIDEYIQNFDYGQRDAPFEDLDQPITNQETIAAIKRGTQITLTIIGGSIYKLLCKIIIKLVLKIA